MRNLITVIVKISGPLKRPRGRDMLTLEIKQGTNLRKLLLKLGYEEKHIPSIMPVVNCALQKESYVLNDGDQVSLSIVIGGG
jgi:hypothetical protein